MRALVAALLVTSTLTAQSGVLPVQPPQPRDPRASMVGGKGVIRGRITAADTGAPMRRATVMIMGPGRRGTYTDADGYYQFTGLPAGTYTLNASPGDFRPVYRPLTWGSSGTGPGKPIELGDGQVIEKVDFALPRGGVITGRVVDPYGEPVARASVYPLMLRLGATEPMQTGPNAQTDDLGQFRLFGLTPGTYIVRADSRMGMFSPGAFEFEGEPVGFMTTYAPGTPSRGEAMRVRVPAGGEVNVDIRLLESRIFSISGAVLSSSGEPTRGVNVSLVHSEPGSSSSFGARMDPNGSFTFRNVPPGTYEIVARLQAPRMTLLPAEGPMPPPSIQEMGFARVDVSTADVENVIVTMRPGETVTGEIVFEEAPPNDFRATISLQMADRRPMYSNSPVTVVGTRFTAKDLFGRYVIRGGVTAPGGPWILKAVLLNGRDITDVPESFSSSHSGHLQVVFTSRSSTLEGTVTGDDGKPTREAQIFLFGADESSWVPFSSRMRSGGFPRAEGDTFTMRGLRDGRYYAIAVPPGTIAFGGPQPPDRALLEELKKVATEVILNPGETRTVDLRLVRFEQ